MNLGGYRPPRGFDPVSSDPSEPLVPVFGPLSGLRVLESARFVAGPWASDLDGECHHCPRDDMIGADCDVHRQRLGRGRSRGDRRS